MKGVYKCDRNGTSSHRTTSGCSAHIFYRGFGDVPVCSHQQSDHYIYDQGSMCPMFYQLNKEAVGISHIKYISLNSADIGFQLVLVPCVGFG